MNRIKSVNRVFLATVLVSCFAPLLGIGRLTDNYLLLLGASQLLLILPAAVYLIVNKVGYREAVRMHKVKPSTVILLILLTFLLMPLLTLVNALSMVFTTNTTTDYMQTLTGQNSLVLSLIGVALIPCILEESVYRGIFYNEYRKAKPVAAIFLSAFLFAILHGNFNQFSYAFIMGIIFALIIEATNSIASTMIVHFIINANSIVLLYAYPKLLWYLEGLYKNAELTGNTAQMDQIGALFGNSGFSLDALMESSEQMVNNMGVWDVLTSYGLSAIVCTILAFIVYRAIAISNGTWKGIKAMFLRPKKPAEQEIPHIRYTLEPEPTKPRTPRLFTPPLIISVAAMLIIMILNELMEKGII